MSYALSDEVIDTRDIATHIRDIITELEDQSTDALDQYDREQNLATLAVYATTLEEFAHIIGRPISEGDDYDGMADDFDHLAYMAGGTMVREDYFTEYAKDLCEQIGDVPADLPDWFVIDWQKTADNLAQDYTEVMHAGATYLFR